MGDSPIPEVLPIPLCDLNTHIANCHIDGFDTQFKVITETESLYCYLVHLYRVFTQEKISQP